MPKGMGAHLPPETAAAFSAETIDRRYVEWRFRETSPLSSANNCLYFACQEADLFSSSEPASSPSRHVEDPDRGLSRRSSAVRPLARRVRVRGWGDPEIAVDRTKGMHSRKSLGQSTATGSYQLTEQPQFPIQKHGRRGLSEIES
jgi:hypothetical protein